MAITLTETAAKRVSTFLANRGKGVGVRLGVRTTGCSGLAYVLEFVDDTNTDDEIFEDHGGFAGADIKRLDGLSH